MAKLRKFLHSTFYILHSRKGFTILELLVSSAIFALIMVSFITMLVAVVRIQSRQSAVVQVNGESQFLLQQIQYYIERSSLIELNQDIATSTLKLRMAASSLDPTYIYLSSSTVYLKQTATGTPQALTTSMVNVTSLVFVKRSNAPGHDSVSVSFVVANNTQNVMQQFSQALQTAVARVSAATFDSNVEPSSTAGAYSLGTDTRYWNSINNVINFADSNVYFTGYVGVNMGSQPSKPFQVNGNVQVDAGDVYVSQSGSGVILRNGASCWRLYVTSDGIATTTVVVPCPS